MNYYKLLIFHILTSWVSFFFLLLLAVLAEHSYKNTKHKSKKKTNNDRTIADFAWLAVILVMILGLIRTAPIIPDLIHPEYESLHGLYECENTNNVDILALTSEDGEEADFRMLSGKSILTADYPRGTYEATIWFTKNGHYVVDVIVEEEIFSN